MKKITREEICWTCKQFGQIIQSCILCKGTGIISLKTIEESDDMKEFIEKKCGWELVEGKRPSDLTAMQALAAAFKAVPVKLY